MKTTYPQYRMTQWIDTSEGAMNKPQATIIYGVQTMREKGGRWMHCAVGSKPMHYDSPDKASEAIKAMRADDAAHDADARNEELAARTA
jgi:hypothetical protein